MFIKRGIITGLGALLLTIGTVAVAAGPSSALPPRDPGGGGGGGSTTPPPPPPSVTTISSIAPSFAWSGDAMTLKGYHFTNATVSVQGLAATITGRTDTQISFTVPSITAIIAGPNSVPVVVSSAYGSASTSFMLSPSLTISGGTTFGVNSQFGQGMDGSAWASATIDRSSGFVNVSETVSNTQFWGSLTVNVSAVWLDSNNKVIGFTTPQSVTSTGVVIHWPSTDPVVSNGLFPTIIGPNAGAGPVVHSGQILLVRDHGADLLSTLNTAWTVGKTIYDVIKALAAFA